MEKWIEIMIKIIKKAALPFSVSIIILSITGYFFGKDMSTISPMCTPTGVPYSTLFQFMVLSLIVGMINTLFDSPYFLKHLRFLYQIMLRLCLIVFITIIFIVVFDWFPLTSFEAWVGFIISFGVCFTFSWLGSLYFIRKKDQEYEKLLETYKERRSSHECN